MFKDLKKSQLLVPFLFLICVGLIQVYSSSYLFAAEKFGDGLYFFKRQSLFAVLAVVVAVSVSRLPLRFWEVTGVWIYWLSGLGVALTLVPELGVKVGGASRWLEIPGLGLRLEPSEFLKLGTVFVLARLLGARWTKQHIKWHILESLVFWVPLGLLLLQPDFGSFAIVIAIAFFMLVIWGVRWIYVAPGLAAAAALFAFLVMSVPYRKNRLMSYLDPWADPAKKGFQVIQSQLAIFSGGFFGVGLGLGQSKLFFLPEAHTDFTLSIFLEEWGLFGLLVLIGVWSWIVIRLTQVAGNQKLSVEQRMIMVGILILLSLAVCLNFGVVIGIFPPKGLTFPLMSYGGSSLLSIALAFGLSMAFERQLWKGLSS